MDISKAKLAKYVSDSWGIAIFEDDGEPVVKILEKWNRVDGSSFWQICGGWYLSTLLEDPDDILYIDYGQNWFVPTKEYHEMIKLMKAYDTLFKAKDFQEFAR